MRHAGRGTFVKRFDPPARQTMSMRTDLSQLHAMVADFESAQVLGIKVNSPVFKVFREFFGSDGKLIYSANLTYPGDALEFNIEFEVDHSA